MTEKSTPEANIILPGPLHFDLNLNISNIKLDEPESQQDIKSRIATRIRDLFKTPPDYDTFEKSFKEKVGDKEKLEFSGSYLSLFSFFTDERHIRLLKSISVIYLDDNDKIKYFALYYSIFERKGEYSLAEQQADAGLVVAERVKDQKAAISFMVCKALMLTKMESAEALAYYPKIVQYSKENRVTESLVWAYRNWGYYLWQKGDYVGALILFEKEEPLRESEGLGELALYYAFLGERLCFLDKEKAFGVFQKILKFSKENKSLIKQEVLAEVCYRLAALALDIAGDSEEFLGYAKEAIEIYTSLGGFESRIAWVSGIASILCERLHNEDEAVRYRDIKLEYIARYGSDRDKFQNDLLRCLEKFGIDSEELKHLEIIASAPGNENLYIKWAVVFGLYQFQIGEANRANNLCYYAISNFISNSGLMSDELKIDLSMLYSLNSDCLKKIGKTREGVEAKIKSVELRPGDDNLRFELCFLAMQSSNWEVAKVNSEYLVSKNLCQPGSYRILARAKIYEGNIDGAIEILEKAIFVFPEHFEMKEELRELHDIKLKIVEIDKSKYFSHIYKNSEDEVTGLASSDYVGLPEYSKMAEFPKGVIDFVQKYTYALQRTPPGFLSNFKSRKTSSLKEGDFRDDFERMMSIITPNFSSEAQQAAGRTDFLIWQLHSVVRESVLFEFKVWGRNDYKDVLSQILRYFTDFQEYAVVFMINPNNKTISQQMVEEVILSNSNYVNGTMRIKPIDRKIQLEHFYCEVQNPVKKRLKVFVFIFDC